MRAYVRAHKQAHKHTGTCTRAHTHIHAHAHTYARPHSSKHSTTTHLAPQLCTQHRNAIERLRARGGATGTGSVRAMLDMVAQNVGVQAAVLVL